MSQDCGGRAGEVGTQNVIRKKCLILWSVPVTQPSRSCLPAPILSCFVTSTFFFFFLHSFGGQWIFGIFDLACC